MLPVSSMLLDAARSGSASPYVRVRVSDRDLGVPRLRFARWVEGEEPDGPAGAAIAGDGSLLRARIDPSTDTLYLQCIEEPSAESAYDSWSSLATAEASPGLGLYAAGARVVVTYYDGDAVVVRESTDHGATFGSAFTVATVGGVTAVSCAIREDGEALVAWAAGGDVYVSSRPALGSWGSPATWSHTLNSVNALAVSDAEDWALLVSGEDGDGAPGCWSTRYGSGVGGPPGHWSTLRLVAGASPGLNVSFRATGIASAGTPRIALVESYAGTGAFDRALIAAGLAGGVFEQGEWRDPAPFAHASPWGVALASDGSDVYASAAGGLWHASAIVAPVDVSAAVLAATYDASHATERLRLILDATLVASTGAVIEGEAEVEFSPGYETDGGPAAAVGRSAWVTSAVQSHRDGRAVFEVEAEGNLGRLQRWRASRLASWPAGERSILASVREVARLAGVRVTTSGASDAATTLTPGFTLRPGESASAAIGRLLARTPDLTTSRGPELIVHEPDAEAAPVYEYGAAHPLQSVILHTAASRIAAARVLGLGVVGEAIAGALDDAGSGGTTVTVVDEGLTTAEQAEARALAMLRRDTLDADRATIEAAPHPGHEPGDVIAVTDAALGLDGAVFRVRSVRFEFTRSPRGRYLMRLGLGAP